MASRIDPKGGWEKYLLVIMGVGLAIVALVLVLGINPVKEATKNLKPRDKSKLEKKELYEEARKKILAAKPKGKKWNDMTSEELVAIDNKVSVEGLTPADINNLVRKIWREECTNEQTMLSDDPNERWKQRVGNKFDKRRHIWLLDETGTLNCPQVEVYADENKSQKAGEMNHDQWVDILEEKGSMTKIRRSSDKMEAWIESKYLKEIYTKDDIAKGPSAPAPKDDGDKPSSGGGGDDEWD